MPPIASFTVNTSFYTVSVDASTSTPTGGIASFDWDWGDGNTGTGVTAMHTYAAQGTYVITLTVTNAEGFDSTTWNVDIVIITNQYRFPLELQTSPFSIPLNPGPVHDTDSVYIYRILPVPISVELDFKTSGVSYVEVFDADNQRFLLPEKTEIDQDTNFNVDWDGKGVFEVRVWTGSFVTDISLVFTLPPEQVISEVKPELVSAPSILAAGIAIAAVGLGFVLGARRRAKK